MQTESAAPEDIDAYIAAQSAAVRPILRRIRRTIAQAAPGATEAVKYRLPTFVLHGNLVHFGAFKKHIGFFALPSGHARFRRALARYAGGKGSVQFPLDQPIPYPLIARIVRYRVRENTAKAAARKPIAHRRR